MADEQYLTPAQVADGLHVTVVTVRRWIANRELRATKAGPRAVDDPPLGSRFVPRRWRAGRSECRAIRLDFRDLSAAFDADGDWGWVSFGLVVVRGCLCPELVAD